MSEDNWTDGPQGGLEAVTARAMSVGRRAHAALAAHLAGARSRLSAALASARQGAASPAPSQPPSAEADDRAARIARLEQEVAAEREQSSRLGREVKELTFKLEILERSYSKQLADARARGTAAERELAEVKAALAETRDELAETTATRDRLRSMLSFDGRRTPPRLEPAENPDDNTINRLLASDDGPSEARPHAPPVEGKVREQEPPPEDLLAPELVFKLEDE